MISKNARVILWFVGLFAVLVCPHFSPLWTTYLFEHGKLDGLARFVYLEKGHSLDYVVGQMQDHLWGPLHSLLAGILLLAFFVKNDFRISDFKFGLVIFIYLIISKWEILFYPPYGDTYTGAFSDAIWLLRHHFDYVGYLHQLSFSQGGPKVYPTTIFPSLLAVLISISPTAKIFAFLAHGITFVLATIVVVYFRKIVLKFWAEPMATLGCVLLISIPLFQSMVELINMEMACLFFAIMSIYYLLENKFFLALVLGVLSTLMKPPGGISCLTIFVMSFLFFILDRKKKDVFVNFFIGIIGVVIVAGLIYLRKKWMVEEVTSNNLTFLIGWPALKVKKYVWIFILTSIGYIFLFIRNLKHNKFLEYTLSQAHVLTIFAMASFWFLSYLNFPSLLSRYELLLLPFFIIAIMYVVDKLINNLKILKQFVMVVALLSFWGAYGFWYNRNIYQPHSNTFEASLEYRNDLKMHMKLAKILEEKFAGFQVAAPVVAAQFLNFSEVGYVSKPLDVMIYGVRSPHEGIKDFKVLTPDQILRTIWVGLAVDQTEPNYPISSHDKIVETIEVGNKKAQLFFGGIGIQKKALDYFLRLRYVKEHSPI